MKKGKVSILGSFIVDLMMRAPHLPIPGETIKGTVFKIGPGGKGSNQAVAAHRAGAEVTIITKIGVDQFTNLAINSFKNEGISTEFVYQTDKAATGAALIMVDEGTGQNKIVVTIGACATITKDEIDKAKNHLKGDIFLAQLENNFDAIAYAINLVHDMGVPVILNPAPADHVSDEILAKVDYLTPNETEASILSGLPMENEADFKRCGEFFLNKGVKNVIFTLGKQGAYLYNANTQKIFPCFNVKVVDTTGAGDAFNGGLATALAEHKSLEEAIVFANAVGSLKVGKMGTAPGMPTRAEIDAILGGK